MHMSCIPVSHCTELADLSNLKNVLLFDKLFSEIAKMFSKSRRN